METIERYILHMDMDAFYAAIEQHDHPELKGLPVLVGGSARDRGVVSTASYEARRFGCRSAMPMATAVKLCPQAVVLPGRMDRYAEVSRQVFEILEHFTPQIEPLSIDEAFLDVTGCRKLFGPPEHIAREIKRRIVERTGLTASVGVAPNKFLAKLASDHKKPDGLVVVLPEGVLDFLNLLPVSRLWGVGKATLPRFEQLGLRTFADVRRLTREDLVRHFGGAGEDFYNFVRGIDDRPVCTESETKSISSETTFATDIPLREVETLKAVLLDQTDQVARRLRRHQFLARTVTLKIRSGDFRTLTRSRTLDTATDETEELWKAVTGLFETWANVRPFAVRLIGVGLSSLATHQGRQMTLFDQPEHQRQKQLDQTLDRIRDKFGRDAITRGLTRQGPEEE